MINRSAGAAARGQRRLLGLFVLAVLAAAGLFVSLTEGAVAISLQDILHILAVHGQDAGTQGQIIWNIRLPRTLVAALVGINLALAGAILQAVMKNPLADPHIIGVSSGAGLAGVAVLILFPAQEHLLTPAAFVGAMLAAALIYILAWKNGIRPIRIILAGVAVSAFLGSGISALLVLYGDRVHGALVWMVGGFSARSWPHFELILPYSTAGVLLALAGARALNVLNLGDEVARGLGLPVEWTRILLTAVAALLAASSVSVAGLLGFVGLVIPHATRLILGTDHRYLLPGSALLGMAVLTISDTLARILFAPAEIPVGILMAFVGAPFFLYLLRREA